MIITPTRAFETILYIHPIEMQIWNEAAIAAMIPKTMDVWIKQGHITQHQTFIQVSMGDSIEESISDRVIEEKLVGLCEILIPNGDSWNNVYLAIMPSGSCCFTDNSQLGERTERFFLQSIWRLKSFSAYQTIIGFFKRKSRQSQRQNSVCGFQNWHDMRRRR